MKVLLGITGSIAAYKAILLTRLLVKAGCEVRVVLSPGAEAFVTPLTLQAVSGHPVHSTLLDAESEAAMDHIALARWADLLLIAPASAQCIAKLAHGLADDLLSTLALATQAPLAIAPAMNTQMWLHPATQANVNSLLAREVEVIGPAQGEQACGELGPGRLVEPEVLAEVVLQKLSLAAGRPLWSAKHVVITSGATREALDPVRYLSNPSTGKMGIALAKAALLAGARVTLIQATTPLTLPIADNLTVVKVTSADHMHRAVSDVIADADVFIGAAAVADFRPADVAAHKIKKDTQSLTLALERTVDIIQAVADMPNKPYTVGFAAETDNVIAYARGKLERKQLDMIIANDVSERGIGFASDDNAVTIVTAEDVLRLDKQSKLAIASQIIIKVAACLELAAAV